MVGNFGQLGGAFGRIGAPGRNGTPGGTSSTSSFQEEDTNAISGQVDVTGTKYKDIAIGGTPGGDVAFTLPNNGFGSGSVIVILSGVGGAADWAGGNHIVPINVKAKSSTLTLNGFDVQRSGVELVNTTPLLALAVGVTQATISVPASLGGSASDLLQYGITFSGNIGDTFTITFDQVITVPFAQDAGAADWSTFWYWA